MEDLKCPVCGKPGIPDYHNEDVICPQCKSDLSIYRVIDQIPEANKGSKIWKIISAVAIMATAVCGLLLFSNLNKQSKNTFNDNSTIELAQLRDSISGLLSDIHDLQNSSNETSSFKYVVRKGDSYWLISKKLYGTGMKAEQIASFNNRTIKTPLCVGDTLIIE